MRPLPLLVAAVLLALVPGCSGRADYDIGEVAPEDHLTGEAGQHEHDHHHEHADGHHEHDEAGLSGSAGSRHVHEAGVRNHGTEWFFNQPWAARFIWGKLARDSAVLLLLAAAVLWASRLAGRRRWR
jgi:hypothetical protein